MLETKVPAQRQSCPLRSVGSVFSALTLLLCVHGGEVPGSVDTAPHTAGVTPGTRGSPAPVDTNTQSLSQRVSSWTQRNPTDTEIATLEKVGFSQRPAQYVTENSPDTVCETGKVEPGEAVFRNGSSAGLTLEHDDNCAVVQNTSHVTTPTQERDSARTTIGSREHPVYMLMPENCTGTPLVFDAREGSIVFDKSRVLTTARPLECRWVLSVSPGHYITVTVQRLQFHAPCGSGWVKLYDSGSLLGYYCVNERPPPLYSLSNVLQCRLFLQAGAHYPSLRISFTRTANARYPQIVVNFTSPSTGYLTSPGYDGTTPYAPFIHSFFTLNVPKGKVVLISFPHLHLESGRRGIYGCDFDYLRVDVLHSNVSVTYCSNAYVPPKLYSSSLRFHFHSDFSQQLPGFRLLFSVHRHESAPRRLPSGLFVCATPTYATFRQHLACNWVPECQRGEDERQCPRSSQACGGALQYGSQCYAYLREERGVSWDGAAAECRRRHASLAGFRTSGELDAFRDVVSRGKRAALILVGLRSQSSRQPRSLYGKVWQWTDGTQSYTARPRWTEQGKHARHGDCAVFTPGDLLQLRFTHCDEPQEQPTDFICEFDARGTVINVSNEIVLPEFHKRRAYCKSAHLFPLIQLPDKQVSQDFLSCDNDEKENSKPVCSSPTFPSFACESTRHIPYTLVCDFHADCADRSDESFCVHQDCTGGFLCDNGQCLTTSQVCDGRQDCRDVSDELFCKLGVARDPVLFNPPPPVVISFTSEGDFRRQSLGSTEHCPDTHFLCPDSDCLPVYVRCNGVHDCPGWEDELRCDSHTCPGFYRCRHSAVCLHPDHLCDGVFQCPLQDDELLCDVSCPPGCRCQGLSAVCPRSFPAHLHPQFRYVDAGGSMMAPDLFNGNVYLIDLRLSHCRLRQLSNVTLPNLQSLDLSDNLFGVLNINSLLRLKNLRRLVLARNPLARIATGDNNIIDFSSTLRSVDFSNTLIRVLNTTWLSAFKQMQSVNLTGSTVTEITDFDSNSSVEVIDLRNTPFQVVPSYLFKPLSRLKEIYGETYMLCCKSNLPEHFDVLNCHAPKAVVSSCVRLIGSDFHRLSLWLLASVAAVANVASVAFLMRRRRKLRLSASVPVTLLVQLSACDACTCLYLLVIGAADVAYSGEYFSRDQRWRWSVTCSLTGALLVMSEHVSGLVGLTWSLGRVSALRDRCPRCPCGGGRATVATCGLLWTLGATLAAAPLLPGPAPWGLYTRTGLCAPLATSHARTLPRHRLFLGAHLGLQLLLALLTLAFLAYVRWSSPVAAASGDADRSNVPEVTLAGCVSALVICDAVCALAVAVPGWLVVVVTDSVPDAVTTGAHFLVKPFNVALSPLLLLLLTARNLKGQESKTTLLQTA